ncbi:MAG: DUF1588 domain-containing protein [Pirellulaceae bacterium]|nr:DUF1588 domain-containing protein [Pirellulaceae bacterium]
MNCRGRLVLGICWWVVLVSAGMRLSADDPTRNAGNPPPAAECLAVDRYFADEVWGKVGERTCLKCHRAGGDAADSALLLVDTLRDRGGLARNRSALAAMARELESGESRLLRKVRGELEHGGGAVLAADSTGYRILARFVGELGSNGSAPAARPADPLDESQPSFFAGVRMLSPQRLLRRATLSLAGRLPHEAERAAVAERGLEALDGILDQLLREDAFYVRLQEGFNDIFLTLGYDGNGEEVLSYEHFEKTRLWYQRHDLSHLPEKDQQRARWSLADVYREAILREPLELIEYIVRNDRPFTELVMADYILVSPYSARGYGVYEELREQFQDPDDPFEYIPTRLRALTNRSGKTQESATGMYPHAGLLSMFHYLRRYPTTETNRNRLRARMFYQHFLGIDVMALAPRVTDAAAVSARYENPTMQAPDCVVCHKTIDPVAGLFQDFNEGGHLGPRKDGWYGDMFGAGFESEKLEDGDRWRALQWLGQRTARDPRFAVAMVEHVYYILTGRKVLQPPDDIEEPRFAARRRAYQEQRRLIEEVAERFAAGGYNLKAVFKDLVRSEFYQADGLATLADDPDRQSELDDVGLVRLLAPEQLERKIAAVFGEKWGRLDDREGQLKILYGGIDSREITERATDPSGAMGAIQRILANDVACRNVALDFTRPPAERLLFPGIEPDVVPGESAEADARIRQAIVHLHQRVLGQEQGADHPEVERTFQLLAGIVSDAKSARGIEKLGSYFCERIEEQRLDDPHYMLRAWRGVVTYLLRQHDFLYE